MAGNAVVFRQSESVSNGDLQGNDKTELDGNPGLLSKNDCFSQEVQTKKNQPKQNKMSWHFLPTKLKNI